MAAMADGGQTATMAACEGRRRMLSFRRNEGLRLLLPLTGRQGVEERGLMWIYLSPNKNCGLRIEGSAASERGEV